MTSSEKWLSTSWIFGSGDPSIESLNGFLYFQKIYNAIEEIEPDTLRHQQTMLTMKAKSHLLDDQRSAKVWATMEPEAPGLTLSPREHNVQCPCSAHVYLQSLSQKRSKEKIILYCFKHSTGPTLDMIHLVKLSWISFLKKFLWMTLYLMSATNHLKSICNGNCNLFTSICLTVTHHCSLLILIISISDFFTMVKHY